MRAGAELSPSLELSPSPEISLASEPSKSNRIAYEINRTAHEINFERKCLRLHLGLEDSPRAPPSVDPPESPPLFYIERAPISYSGATCRLPGCPNRILPGEYRVALNPGMQSWRRYPDYYHISCFETLVDLSDTEYLSRITPATLHTACKIVCLVDGGAEMLILGWKRQRRRWIEARDDNTKEVNKATLDKILYRVESAGFEGEKLEGVSAAEYSWLAYALAPVESDGPEDTEEWNLFERYLPADDGVESLDDRHSLSDILRFWNQHIVCFRLSIRTFHWLFLLQFPR